MKLTTSLRKNYGKKLFILFIFSILIFITGCEKDQGISTSDRDKFIGSWLAQSNGSRGTRNFTLTITASNSASDQVIMQNFDGGGSNTFIPATISGSSLSIIRTIVAGETIEGSGSYSGNLNFTFTLDDGQTIENRTCTAHK